MTNLAKPAVLLIMDGWGHRDDEAYNAPKLAKTPALDALDATAPKAFLLASGPAVGLPEGQVGNSEVGHMTIGAGRVILQDLARIDEAVADGSIKTLPQLDEFANGLIKSGGTAHLMGLVSNGGVHSRDAHIMSLAQALSMRGVKVAIHAFTDGRDTLPRLAAETLQDFQDALPDKAKLATICGRYYAMDRDRRWQRNIKAYQAMTHAHAGQAGHAEHHHANAGEAIALHYEAGLGDEFIPPMVIGDYQGMGDGDAILMANFRADRVRQILTLYELPHLARFEDKAAPALNPTLGLVSYSDELDEKMQNLFEQPHIANTLGAVVAQANKTQLRLAESEKYPHVTFFFNGGAEEASRGEERSLIDSPKVATYDLQPEMSAKGVTTKLIKAIKTRSHDLIIVNFANPDMVGHTGDLKAAITACEVVDASVGEAVQAIIAAGGMMLITSDHGNCDIMWDEDAKMPHTAHSYNPVPIYLVGQAMPQIQLKDGTLSDIAPTLLELMGLPIPQEMSGKSLLGSGD